jgi:hypothetical protein
MEEGTNLKKLRLSYLDIKSDFLLKTSLKKVLQNNCQLIDLDISGLGMLPI